MSPNLDRAALLVEESAEYDIRRLFEINFLGLVRMTTAVLPIMRERKSVTIVNVPRSRA